MLIPVEWLTDFVDINETPQDLADRLTVTGNEIEEIRESDSGPVYYLKLTPNRADMLALAGAGREIAALYQRPFRSPEAKLEASGAPALNVRVEVDEPELCPRYVARIIRGVKIGPSPDWLRKRLEAAGERSISNVVDATNYVMLEMGQPLHAFDLDKLIERRILVRKARPDERFIAIGGEELTLSPEMLVIADGGRAVAIAGVKGGQETEVGETTVDILLESAYFDPVSVRRTSKRTGIATTASYRFERGVDPNGVLNAANRAAALIAELSGGTVSESVFDVYPNRIQPKRIRFRPERCRALLGVEVPDADAESFLTRLGIEVLRESADVWTVTPPTNRPDLAIEEDLIEEVGRIYGYEHLPETLPSGVSGAGKLSAQEELIRTVRDQLTAQGMFEAVTNTLTSRSVLEKLHLERSPAWPESEGPPSLRNPLSADIDTLRPSILPGLIQAVGYNLRHGVKDIYLFEAGYGNALIGGVPDYRLLVAGVLLGSRWTGAWNPDKSTADFYTARGIVETLAHSLGLEGLEAERADHPAFHPGRSAWLSYQGRRLGIAGELHPSVALAVDLPRGLYAFELDGAALMAHTGTGTQYEAPSRFPRALRDIAVIVDQKVPSARIEAILREEMGDFARSVRLFDAYIGKGVPEDCVSLAYALELGSEERTLTDAEVDARVNAARQRLASDLDAEFRG
jgi:phenylalanyl-tRNA synthetase beta chain